MSNNTVNEMKKMLDSACPELPPPTEPLPPTCKYNQNGTRRWRFSVYMLLLAIFLLILSFTLPSADQWLCYLMSITTFIAGTLNLEASTKEMESTQTTNTN